MTLSNHNPPSVVGSAEGGIWSSQRKKMLNMSAYYMSVHPFIISISSHNAAAAYRTYNVNTGSVWGPIFIYFFTDKLTY